MKSIISVGDKFIKNISPIDLVNMIEKSKYTKGVELAVDYLNPKEMKFLDDIVPLLNSRGLILQIHGNVELAFDKQLSYMKELEKYAAFLGYPIVVTMHTVFDEDTNVSIKKSVEYLGDLINKIDNNKLVIALENLNSMPEQIRLTKEQIRPLVLNDEKLFFTYDVGHTIADYENLTDLDEYMIEDIRNIHLHTCNRKGIDHQPIYKKDLRWNDIVKALLFLKKNKYAYNITFEYDLYDCKGETIQEKIADYLASIDMVSERYN